MDSYYKKIELAIRFINDNLKSQPSLEEIAKATGLSPYHFQRLFKQWAGITPKRFLQYLTVEHAKHLLKDASVFDVSLEMGLSSQSRLHDHFVSLDAVSPGQFKNRGKNTTIECGIGHSPFGDVFIAATNIGICQLSFIDAGGYGLERDALQQAWVNANIVENHARIAALSAKIFHPRLPPTDKFHLLVQGSNFQIKVWECLLHIPAGSVFSYNQVAHLLRSPKGSRAVANAISKNPIGYLIPCHRVIRSTGVISGYRWGRERKQAMLAWESARGEN